MQSQLVWFECTTNCNLLNCFLHSSTILMPYGLNRFSSGSSGVSLGRGFAAFLFAMAGGQVLPLHHSHTAVSPLPCCLDRCKNREQGFSLEFSRPTLQVISDMRHVSKYATLRLARVCWTWFDPSSDRFHCCKPTSPRGETGVLARVGRLC